MPGNTPQEQEALAECKKEEDAFYKQAFDGFSLAISKENYPMCGMEQNTLDYLLAYMAFHFKQYEVASKFLSSVLTSPSASRRMKDVGLQLKEDIIAELKK